MKTVFLSLLMSATCVAHALNWNVVTAPPPRWMIDQIEEDLEPFSTELGTEAIDGFFKQLGEARILTRVRVQGGEISFEYSDISRTHAMTPWVEEGFRKLASHVHLPDVDFLFTSGDTVDHNKENAPIFSESKLGSLPAILFPDRWALKGYIPEKLDVLAGNTRYRWEEKIPLLFFRGSDTTRDPGLNWCNWDNIPRVRFVRLSLERPDMIDARFYYSLHNFAKVEEAKREGLITMDYYPLRDHPRYKYLMDLDGNCAACPRTAAIFHSNSVVFKEVSPSKQWWYKLLSPYVHYIPVAGDLSDVFTQIEWARTNDETCRMISKNGRELVLDVLSEARIYQYLYHLLVAYSNKQNLQRDA